MHIAKSIQKGSVLPKSTPPSKKVRKEIQEMLANLIKRGLRPGAEMYHSVGDATRGEWGIVQSIDTTTGDIVCIFKKYSKQTLNVRTAIPIIGKCPFGDEYVYIDSETVMSMKNSGTNEHVVSCTSKEAEIDIHFILIAAFAD